MEDLWQKFKEETTEDLNKIKNFLNEMSQDEKSLEKKIVKHLSPKPARPVKTRTPRKKIYGKLKDLVQEIMEKENLSRAQAYRVARKRLDNF